MAEQLSLAKLSTQPDPAEAFREDLEDAAKDYSEDDVLIEVLQNALDALDQRRFQSVIEVAGYDPNDQEEYAEAIKRWNTTVTELLAQDQDKFDKALKASHKETQLAVLYEKWSDDDARRNEWWTSLGERLEAEASDLEDAASSGTLSPAIAIRIFQATKYIEVEDNGVGMDLTTEDPLKYFRHKGSTKRQSRLRDKRRGERGNHGWGLTSVLAFSDDVQVISKTTNSSAKGLSFRNFRSYADGSAKAEVEGMSQSTFDTLMQRSNIGAVKSGTVFRIALGAIDTRTYLGWLLDNFTLARAVTYLRLKTPVGQVNDFLLHPAYYCYRKGDNVSIKVIDEDSGNSEGVELDFFRLNEVDPTRCVTYAEQKNNPAKNVSIHTIGRYKSSNDEYLLTGADIQEAVLLREFERDLEKRQAIPARIDEAGEEDFKMQQSFLFAYSGGLLSPTLGLEAKGNNLMFRGVTLCDQMLPTLARRHLPDRLDGRGVIAKASSFHTNAYDGVRSHLKDKGVGGVGSPAVLIKRQKQVGTDLAAMKSGEPVSPSLKMWAPHSGGEAKVMLLFAELLGRGIFGDFRIIACGLGAQYDFTFLYDAKMGAGSIPPTATANNLVGQKYADKVTIDGDPIFRWIGFGEYKYYGESLFDDVGPTKGIKDADEIDLLVCWTFDTTIVGDQKWDSTVIGNDLNRVLPYQTHVWNSLHGADIERSRPLPVIVLEDVLQILASEQKITSPPSDWPSIENYYAAGT